MSLNMTRLKNGLTVVSDTIPFVETVAVGIWVASGSRHETSRHMGISHFLEHMAFKGTTTRSAQDIALALESVGGHMNAYTTRESTAYYMRVLTEDVSLAIDILGDILQHSTFVDDEMERERQVILQEIYDTSDQPDDVVFDGFYEAAFGGNTPMGWPILGTVDTVTVLNRETLIAHMQNRYTAPHMVLAAAGNISHQDLVKRAEDTFCQLPTHDLEAETKATYVGGTFKMQRDLEQLHRVYGYKAAPLGHENYHAGAILATLLGGGMSSRLFQEVREKRGLAYSIYAFISGFKDVGVLGIYAGTSPEKSGELEKVLQGELEKLPTTLTHQEITRAKIQLKASLMMAWESISTRTEQLAQQVLIHGRPLTSKEIIQRLEAVPDDLVKTYAAQTLIHPQTFSMIGPLNRIV